MVRTAIISWCEARDVIDPTSVVHGFHGWPLGLILLLSCFALVGARRLRAATDSHKRGAVISNRGQLTRRRRRAHRRSAKRALQLADLTIPPHDETKHFKIVGTTGTGKSTAIREILAGALRRGDRAVIADPDGGYLRRFYDRYRGDVILNPFEPYSVRWDPFQEIRTTYDVDQLASGLVPTTGDAAGQEWRSYARTFLSAVMRRCYEINCCDTRELWRLLTIASCDELRPIVAGSPAQPFLDPDNGRMFGSIRSVTGSAIAALEYILPQRSLPFSVRGWVKSGRGVLFIPYRAGQIAALRSIIATWMRLAIFEAMSQIEDEDQHLWLVVDELDALGAIDGLKDALTRLRKFGGRCVLGFQSIAQVSCTYGPGEAQTIIENCGNSLILRCSGSDSGGTSHFASRLIGEREIVRRHTSYGRDKEGAFASRAIRHSRQVSAQHATELAVMASELEQLPDLTGFWKSASGATWSRVALRS
jgi:type IV secretory pathway TraG/TraD family ATPase VirD4